MCKKKKLREKEEIINSKIMGVTSQLVCSMKNLRVCFFSPHSKFRSDFIMQTQQSVARDGALKCLQPKAQQCPVSDSKHQETQLQPQICSTILSLRAVLCRGRWYEGSMWMENCSQKPVLAEELANANRSQGASVLNF